MKKHYRIECWNTLFRKWIFHNYKKYKNLQEAQKVISSYKENKLGVKFRTIEIKIIDE
jgi:hypothetical protein